MNKPAQYPKLFMKLKMRIIMVWKNVKGYSMDGFMITPGSD
ncbi:hypothetical protein [Staphylococcus epidermidis]|nr:hypothetical protein [Staphylococcus epidermidis]MDE4585902.1 hypothetical protein [Staphylococcus epidermidis]